MLRPFLKPRTVLTRTRPPPESHHTTDVCGNPSGMIVVSAATRGQSTRSACDRGISAAGRLTTPCA